MAAHAISVQNGLDLVDVRKTFNGGTIGGDLLGRFERGHGLAGERRFGRRFMASDAGELFAGHGNQPAAEELDRTALFVQRLNRNGRVRRNLEHGGPVLFNLDVAQYALAIPAALDTQMVVIAGLEIAVNIAEDAQGIYFAQRNALDPGAAMNVLDVADGLLVLKVDTIRDGGRALALLEDIRLYHDLVLAQVFRLDRDEVVKGVH